MNALAQLAPVSQPLSSPAALQEFAKIIASVVENKKLLDIILEDIPVVNNKLKNCQERLIVFLKQLRMIQLLNW